MAMGENFHWQKRSWRLLKGLAKRIAIKNGGVQKQIIQKRGKEYSQKKKVMGKKRVEA